MSKTKRIRTKNIEISSVRVRITQNIFTNSKGKKKKKKKKEKKEKKKKKQTNKQNKTKDVS